MRTLTDPNATRGNVRWAFAETIRLVGCERCSQRAGQPCLDRDDEPLGTPHLARLHAYHDHIGAAEYTLRHTKGAKP